ncbi:MAG: tRNA lysidine(34) synthetase TilS [Candidatus Omnitrophica bacterium]|nr:tRNA lysidine(34) synthetase TilS [Candidatus Omnitrophota bacterium]
MFKDNVRQAIKKHSLVAPKDKIVIGVSGGPDSLALLYVLDSLKKELNFSLHIAHLDHSLRSDSYRDAKFIERLSKNLGLPCAISKINLKKLHKKGSLEEAARNARYNFFVKLAKKIKADKIALGHNLDDQAETVLMRILRGAGLYGLRGILPKRTIFGFSVIRPLIGIRRKEIECYLKRNKIKPRIDSTNLKDIYLRNKIRNNLIPLLEKKYNRKIKEVLSSLAQSAGYDYDYLFSQAQGILKGKRKNIPLNEFLRLHPAMQRMVLRLAIAQLKGNMRRINLQHIIEIEDMLLNRPIDSIVDLPQGISIMKKRTKLIIYRRIPRN